MVAGGVNQRRPGQNTGWFNRHDDALSYAKLLLAQTVPETVHIAY